MLSTIRAKSFYSLAASNFSLQGETQVKEMNWLTFDWFKNTDTTPNTTRLIINQESKLELTSPKAQPIINQESNPELTSPEAEVTVSTSSEAVIIPPTPIPTPTL
jgi:flagellar hook-length control protein FliK